MRILLSFIIYSMLSSGVFIEKNKDKEMNMQTPEKAVNINYLADERGWRLFKVKSDKPCDTNNDGILTTNIVSEMPACMLDDILFIQKNSNIAYYKRGISCCDDSKNNAYNWTLKGKTLILSQNGIDDPMIIQSISKDEMIVTTRMEAQGEIYTFSITFIH